MNNNKASDSYIYYRKKFCDQRTIQGINLLVDEWAATPCEVITRLIKEGIEREKNKKKQIEDFKRGG